MKRDKDKSAIIVLIQCIPTIPVNLIFNSVSYRNFEFPVKQNFVRLNLVFSQKYRKI